MKAPILRTLFGRAEVAPPPDVEAAALRSDRFRLEREGDWRRLDAIVTRMEKGRLRGLSDPQNCRPCWAHLERKLNEYCNNACRVFAALPSCRGFYFCP